jgi:class 3 adenylate cyclase
MPTRSRRTGYSSAGRLFCRGGRDGRGWVTARFWCVATVTVSVLFTDLVGSTEFSARVGPETADEIRREYFGLLRAAFRAHGGVEVKSGGDGLMVVFAAAAEALAGAVAAQRSIALRNRRANEPLAMRVGVSAGDMQLEDGDYFGMPVVEAARLCAVATGGQILVSDLVRTLAGSRGRHDFCALGEQSLKGVPAPVGVVEVSWTAHDVSALPLPARLALELERGPLFVGRVGELGRLREAWKRAVGASRQVLMLVGEPGIGKTRRRGRATAGARFAAKMPTATPTEQPSPNGAHVSTAAHREGWEGTGLDAAVRRVRSWRDERASRRKPLAVCPRCGGMLSPASERDGSGPGRALSRTARGESARRCAAKRSTTSAAVQEKSRAPMTSLKHSASGGSVERHAGLGRCDFNPDANPIPLWPASSAGFQTEPLPSVRQRPGRVSVCAWHRLSADTTLR